MPKYTIDKIIQIVSTDYHTWVKTSDGMVWCSCYNGQRIF